MREIKFRAWDKKENKMQQVVQILYGHEASNYPLSVDFFRSVKLKSRLIKDIELMQYTGLKDKNYKEIYDGDIIKDKQDIYIVDLLKGAWVFYKPIYLNDNMGKYETSKTFFDYYEDMAHDIEIIGNIFENKELIK